MLRNVLLLLIALPAFAGGLVVSPSSVNIRVGEQIVLHAGDEPGGLSGGFPYDYTFQSDDPSVAEVHGFASGSGYLQPYPYPNNGNVYVTGIAPGVAHVVTHGWIAKLTTITVTEARITLTPPVATVRSGDSVTMVAFITGGYQNVLLEWYLGHTGDLSHLLAAGPLLSFRPPAAKTYVWVRAIIGASITTEEVEINVMARSRAARH